MPVGSQECKDNSRLQTEEVQRKASNPAGREPS